MGGPFLGTTVWVTLLGDNSMGGPFLGTTVWVDPSWGQQYGWTLLGDNGMGGPFLGTTVWVTLLGEGLISAYQW